MRYHIFTFLCLLYIVSGCATEEYTPIVGQIEGIVINEKTKDPIERCEVTSRQFGSTLTDSYGRYSFSDVTPGTVLLTYSCDQFQTITREFVVSAGKTTQANISLSPIEVESKLQPDKTMLDFGNRDGVIDLILKNISSKPISYSINCDAAEIHFEPQRGTVAGGNSNIVKVAIDRTELSEGHYERTASIITENSTIDLYIIFDKGSATRPKVSTLALKQGDNLDNSIVAKGNIISVGSSNIIQHGFCYSFDAQPSLTNNDGVINRGSASTMTDFSAIISNLEYEKTYYVCAFATNKEGTSYGEILSLILAPKENISITTDEASSVTSTSAKLKLKILGGVVSDFDEIGFYYGTSTNCEKRVAADIENPKNENEIEVAVENLMPDTEYYFKSYGKRSGGEIVGEIRSFKTQNAATKDSYSLTTEQASNIKETEATFNGLIDVVGNVQLREYGFYYGTSSNPTIRLVAKSFNSPTSVSTTNVSVTVKDLSEATTYYYQLYTIDKDYNIIRGEVVQFSTKTTPSIVIDFLNVSASLGLSGKATLYPEGNTILEAGFIYRTDGYDLTLSSNYNGKTVKVPCEIISNTITMNTESIGGYLGGGYVRAYMILVDGTIVYNGPKIYVATDLPYPRD